LGTTYLCHYWWESNVLLSARSSTDKAELPSVHVIAQGKIPSIASRLKASGMNAAEALRNAAALAYAEAAKEVESMNSSGGAAESAPKAEPTRENKKDGPREVPGVQSQTTNMRRAFSGGGAGVATSGTDRPVAQRFNRASNIAVDRSELPHMRQTSRAPASAAKPGEARVAERFGLASGIAVRAPVGASAQARPVPAPTMFPAAVSAAARPASSNGVRARAASLR
jgi:hypothetical protein